MNKNLSKGFSKGVSSILSSGWGERSPYAGSLYHRQNPPLHANLVRRTANFPCVASKSKNSNYSECHLNNPLVLSYFPKLDENVSPEMFPSSNALDDSSSDAWPMLGSTPAPYRLPPPSAQFPSLLWIPRTNSLLQFYQHGTRPC